MTRIKKLTLTALVALALAVSGAAYVPTHQLAGDPSQWGVYKKGSFDITETEVAGRCLPNPNGTFSCAWLT